MGPKFKRYTRATPLFLLTSITLLFVTDLSSANTKLNAAQPAALSAPNSIGIYMVPGDKTPYTITVKNGPVATALAENPNITPETLAFLFAAQTGSISGNFETPDMSAANTNCTGERCVISFDNKP